MRRGFQNLAILALALSVGSGSSPSGKEGSVAVRSAAGAIGMAPSAGAFATRGNPPATGEPRFEPLGLSPLRPPAAGRIPVVLVHGLWGSPRMWGTLIRALEADSRVSGRFQLLTFGYSGGGPIPHTASLLRSELRALRDRLDPDRSDPSWERMVLVGHSLGGLLCKMMAQDSGTRLLDLITDRRIEELAGPAGALEQLKAEVIYKPLPEVRRVIFIATPHRGSPLVLEPVRAIASRLARPAVGSQRAHASLLVSNDPMAFRPAFRAGFPTSIDELDWNHPLLLAVDGLPIDPKIERHSIIADRRKPPRTDGGDGLVPYASAGHPGATSEFLVSAGHLRLAEAEVIGAVARILEEHAARRDPPLRAPEAVVRPREIDRQPPGARAPARRVEVHPPDGNSILRKDRTMIAPRDVLARVRAVIVHSLGVDEADVTPAATLVGELGAESIDFLDIAFRLEREFGINVLRGELFIEPTSLGGAVRDPDGRLTAADLAALRTQMPYADLSGVVRDRRPEKLADLFTVDLLVRYVTWKLEGRRSEAEVTGAAGLAVPRTIGR